MKSAAEVLAEETVVLSNNDLSEPEKVLEIATRLIHRIRPESEAEKLLTFKQSRLAGVCDELTEIGVEGLEEGLELV